MASTVTAVTPGLFGTDDSSFIYLFTYLFFETGFHSQAEHSDMITAQWSVDLSRLSAHVFMRW